MIPISALQHHLFCPRQCALIHIDGLWAENRLTAQGRAIHERSDTPGSRTRAGPERVRTVRALPLLCRGLGLTGKADQVELPVDSSGRLIGSPRPVEHKRGRPKRLDHDRVQLAAQALCLEEMFGLPVPVGELFYAQVRRRETVAIDDRLRKLVERVTAEVRDNLLANRVPPAERKPKCRSCSLLHLCMPGGTGPDRDPRRYLARSLASSLGETGPEDPP
ncbi:MAG: CRISPR-associated protein Cas4 [Phycisphaerales bacterium]|nr:CRISPR-associated protein Cas4 [Phycisphaerales bacterium]